VGAVTAQRGARSAELFLETRNLCTRLALLLVLGHETGEISHRFASATERRLDAPVVDAIRRDEQLGGGGDPRLDLRAGLDGLPAAARIAGMDGAGAVRSMTSGAGAAPIASSA
jgi:hypothetical protein